MRKAYLYFLSFTSFHADAQWIHPTSMNNRNSIGAYSAITTDAYSFLQNQSSLANNPNSYVALYNERRFMLKELSFSSAVVSLSSLSGGLAFLIDHTGNSSFNESTFAMAFGKKLGEVFSIGAQFNYTLHHAETYGSSSSISIAVAVKFVLTERLQAGFQLTSAAERKENYLPFNYRAGMGYDLSDQVFLQVEMLKETGYPVNSRVSVHYRPSDELFFGAGVYTGRESCYFMSGYRVKKASITFSVAYHSSLGFTPSLLIAFIIQQKRSKE